MADNPADVLVPRPEGGRVFTTARRVRWGDLTRHGRVRLNSLGAYVADIGSDDFGDLGIGGDYAWLVRRTLVEIRRPARFLEDLTIATWCSGLGLRWAERRVSMAGSAGAEIEVALLWVAYDNATGQSTRLPNEVRTICADAAGDRRVSATLQHREPPAAGNDAGVASRPWPLRAIDFDGFNHVNHAKALTILEEVLDERPHLQAPLRCEIEYPRPIEHGNAAELVVADEPDGSVTLWTVDPDMPRGPNAVYSSARLVPLAR